MWFSSLRALPALCSSTWHIVRIVCPLHSQKLLQTNCMMLSELLSSDEKNFSSVRVICIKRLRGLQESPMWPQTKHEVSPGLIMLIHYDSIHCFTFLLSLFFFSFLFCIVFHSTLLDSPITLRGTF